MSTRICPRCSSFSVHRARRRGLLETVLLPLLALRPYRCMNCWRRHYGLVFTQHYRTRIQPSVITIQVPVPVLRGAFALVLLAIPMLLPGAAPVLRTPWLALPGINTVLPATTG